MNKLQPIFSVAIVVGLILAASGCGSPLHGIFADATLPAASQLSHVGSSSNRYDAGVLFANEASYVCLPLEKFGIDPAQEIVSVKSSCECVRPSVVRYLQLQSQEGFALRLDFIGDSKGQDEMSPISLAVEIQFEFADGAKQSASIQFLHTTQKGKSFVMTDTECRYNFGEIPIFVNLKEVIDATGSIDVCFWGIASDGDS